jgi:hypothetical protein
MFLTQVVSKFYIWQEVELETLILLRFGEVLIFVDNRGDLGKKY